MKESLTFIVLTAGSESEQQLQAALVAQQSLRVIAASDSTENVYAETIRWQPSAVILTLGKDLRAVWD